MLPALFVCKRRFAGRFKGAGEVCRIFAYSEDVKRRKGLLWPSWGVLRQLVRRRIRGNTAAAFILP